jgi:monofunctional biosynthetic peptidoglycan transglycosylase
MNILSNSSLLSRKISFRSLAKWIGFSLALVLGACLIFVAWIYFTLPDVRPLIHQNPSTTAFIELRRTQAQQKGNPFELQWKWVGLDQISPYLKTVVMEREDTTFWSHNGVMWSNIWQAMQVNWELKHFKYGASTITQQVAKNIYLSPARTLQRKITEWFLAYELERHLSKERILEIYFNIVEWGDGIFGAEAAAQYWFHTPAANLQPKQAIRLAMTLSGPLLYSPLEDSPLLNFTANKYIALLAAEGLLSDQEVLDSLWLGMPSRP